MFFETFFDYPQRTNVVIISDSTYKKVQRQQLESDLTVLQSRANRHRTALKELEQAIGSKEKEIAALTPVEPDNLPSESVA